MENAVKREGFFFRMPQEGRDLINFIIWTSGKWNNRLGMFAAQVLTAECIKELNENPVLWKTLKKANPECYDFAKRYERESQ